MVLKFRTRRKGKAGKKWHADTIHMSAMRLDEAMAHLEDYLTNSNQPDQQEIDVMYKVIIQELAALKK
jgi:hypothetical protein